MFRISIALLHNVAQHFTCYASHYTCSHAMITTLLVMVFVAPPPLMKTVGCDVVCVLPCRGFSVHTGDRHQVFKPSSVQSMW